MEIPPHLKQRTQDLLQELGSEVGKDAANQFISEYIIETMTFLSLIPE